MARPALVLTVALAACGGVHATAPDGAALDAASSPDAPAWTRTPGDVVTAVLHVPSSAAGAEGVLVYAAWPADAGGARDADGAPVVVQVPGGHEPIAFPPPGTHGYADVGVVWLVASFPGATVGPLHGGGTYDYRGPACQRALADVLRFAQGDLAATVEGQAGAHTLAELVGYPVLGDEVGVLALSNGGNVAAAALGAHGEELPGVAWLAGWENPTGDQMVVAELGGLGAPANPHYTQRTCTTAGCPVDTATLALDPTAAVAVTDPADPTAAAVALPGAVFFDDDGDGVADPGEYRLDHPLGGRVAPGGALEAFYSVDLTTALAARGLATGAIASLADAQAYWGARDPLLRGAFDAAVANRPALAVMVLASEVDHAQTSPDHPHVKVQLDAWRAAGAAFLRLNPDAAYLAQVGADAAPESAAGVAYGWDDLLAGLEPEATEQQNRLATAAVEELADRAHLGRWDADLDAPLAW